MDLSKEIEIAKKARYYSYAPYSHYYVGCALHTKNGKIYSGCNIENHGLQSICAERVAFTKAISEGEKDFDYIVVCGGSKLNSLENCLPCGYCRQFMSEFVSEDFKIYAVCDDESIKEYTIKDLLPHSFKL